MAAFDSAKKITVTITGNTTGLNKSFGQAVREADTFGKKMAVVGNTLKGMAGPALIGAAAAAGAFAIKLGVDAVQGAAAEQIELNKLQTALDNVGQGFRRPEVDAFIQKLQMATGTSDSDLRPAFQQLVTTTGDVTQAMGLMNVAMDVAAARNVDVATAADALAKAAGGSTKAIGSLTKGAIDPAIIKSGNLAKIVDALQSKFGGQAASAANTFTGKIARMQQAVGELSDSFGSGFISAFDNSTTAVDEFQNKLIEMQPTLETSGRIIGDLASNLLSLGPVFNILAAYTSGYLQQINLLSQNFMFIAQHIPGLSSALDDQADSTDNASDSLRILETDLAQSAKEVAAMNRATANTNPLLYQVGDSAAYASDEMSLLREDIRLTTRSLGPLATAFDEANAAMNRRQAMQDYRDALKEFITDPSAETRDAVVASMGEAFSAFDDPKQGIKFTGSAINDLIAAAKDAGVRIPPEVYAIQSAWELANDPIARAKQLMEEIPNNIPVTIDVKLNLPSRTLIDSDGNGIPDILEGMATGGPVFGSGGYVGARMGTHASDSVRARLSRGEYVLNADTVKRLGIGTLNSLNNGGGMGGGMVIEQLNVNAAPGERAEDSVPRALRRMAFVAGLNG